MSSPIAANQGFLSDFKQGASDTIDDITNFELGKIKDRITGGISKGINKGLEKYPIIGGIALLAIASLVISMSVFGLPFSLMGTALIASPHFSIMALSMPLMGVLAGGYGLYNIHKGLSSKFGHKSWFQTLSKLYKAVTLPLAYAGAVGMMLYFGPTTSMFGLGLLLICAAPTVAGQTLQNVDELFRSQPKMKAKKPRVRENIEMHERGESQRRTAQSRRVDNQVNAQNRLENGFLQMEDLPEENS